MFMNYFDCANDLQIKQFNDKMAMVIENLRDFVILHYQVKKNDTEFWSNLKNIPIPPSLQHKLDLWKDRLPIREDFPATSYCLFYEMNFISIMYGLKLFDKDKLTKIYNGFSPEHKQKITDNINYYNNIKNEWQNNSISHKKWLANMRTL